MEKSFERRELALWKKAAGKLNFMSGIISLYMKPELSQRALKQIARLHSSQDIALFLQNELSNIDVKDRQHFLVSIATPIHERKHWHDYIGTTLGFELFWSSVEYYSRIIMILRHLSTESIEISLPLKKTFYHMASDQHALEFSHYNSLYKKFIKQKVFQVENIDSDIREVTKKAFSLPYLKDMPFVSSNGKNPEYFFSDVPLTGISLLEASAVLTEFFSLYDILGESESHSYLNRYQKPDLWIYNSVINGLKNATKNVSIELMLAIISNCLMYPINRSTKESNPIERFKAFLDSLSELKAAPTSLQDIKQWIISVFESNNWAMPVEIAKQHILFSKSKIDEINHTLIEENREADSLESYLIYYLNHHIKFFEYYKANPIFWAADYFYKALPSPLALENHYDLNSIIILDKTDASLGWYSITNAIDQLFELNKTNFTCPFKNICSIKIETCGKLPLSMPPQHPECYWLVAMCDLLAPNWKISD